MVSRALSCLVGVAALAMTWASPATAQDRGEFGAVRNSAAEGGRVTDEIAGLLSEATDLVEDEVRLMHALGALDVGDAPPIWLGDILTLEPAPTGTRSELVDQLVAVEQAAQTIRDVLASRGHVVSGPVDAVLVMQPVGVHQALRSSNPPTLPISQYRRGLDDLKLRMGRGLDSVSSMAPSSEPSSSISLPIPSG